MINKILNRTAKILVVEPAGAARLLVTEVLKAMGFSTVQGLPAIEDAISYLETEQWDWVITTLGADNEEVNALSLMQFCTTYMRTVRFSLLLTEAEKKYLPKAFELGLIGWHLKPFTKDTFKESMRALLEQAEKSEGKESLLAAEQLRSVLREEKMYKDWTRFEQNLLNLHPGNARLLMNSAEPYALSNNVPRALSILKQAQLLDPSIAEEVDDLLAKYSKLKFDDNKESQPDRAMNVLGIPNAVIIDSDETIQTALVDMLVETGVEDVQCFSDGRAAAEYIAKHPNPGLVIQEWRIPNLSGPLFLQRILHNGASTSPIILLSSLIQKTDMPLLKELGISALIPKPFDRIEFLSAMIWTLQEHRLPRDQGMSEINFRKYLNAEKNDEAFQIMNDYLQVDSIPVHKKSLMQAEWFYAKKDYTAAKEFAMDALKGASDSIIALNLLGKIFMQQRDFESALKCLQTAQNMSPKNIERLCHIAEAQEELGQHQDADDTLEEAKNLDPDSLQVAEAEARLAIGRGDVTSARSMMAKIEHLENIVAYMNNKAVAFARCDQLDESIAQYQRTIEALPPEQDQLRSLVYYNLGLALARANELEKAFKYVSLALKKPNKKIKAKAHSLQTRLKEAVDTGKDFHLFGLPTSEMPSISKFDRAGDNNSEQNDKPLTEQAIALENLSVKPGEIGCFLLYLPERDLNGHELLKTIRFIKRGDIQIDEPLSEPRPDKVAS